MKCSNNINRNFRRNIFVFICLFLSFETFGQDKNSLDQNFTPPKASILGSDLLNSNSGHNSSEFNNSIRLNLTNLIRANAILSYERMISKNFSITTSLGVPFERDLIQSYSGEILEMTDFYVSSNQSSVNYLTVTNNTSFKSGYLGGISFRLYSDGYSDNNSTFYYELGTKSIVRNLNWKDAMVEDVYYSSEVPIVADKERLVTNSYFFNIGSQWSGGKRKVLFVNDLSVGIGLRVSRFNSYQEYSYPLFDSSSYKSVLLWDGQREMNLYPYISVTYCLGIGW